MKCFEWELERIDWTALRASSGRTAASIPDALRSLAAAGDDREAEESYWRIDNVVVVQGSVFEAAEYILGPALLLLSYASSDVVRRWVLELLIQVSTGWVDDTERALGNTGLDQRCRARVCEGIAQVYSLLDATSWEVRDRAVDFWNPWIRIGNDLHGSYVVWQKRTPIPKFVSWRTAWDRPKITQSFMQRLVGWCSSSRDGRRRARCGARPSPRR